MTTAAVARAEVRGTASDSVVAAVGLRPLEPGESAAVLAVFAGLSQRSRELRFLGHKPALSDAEVWRLTAVDQRDHVALVASAPGRRPIGIARFVCTPDDPACADVAVAVVDAWQRLGVGSMLLGALAHRAVEVGVGRFTLTVSTDNSAVLRLLHRSSVEVSRTFVGRGVAEYTLTLPGGPL